MFWFLSGSTNINDLDSKIWDEWADEHGECGPIYGKQWRAWDTPYGHLTEVPQGVLMGKPTDQLAEVIQGIKDNPTGRRHLVSAWNPSDIPDMALPPCHYAFRFYVEADGSLSIMVHQRSADMMLGVPYNMASYSLLLMMVARCVGRRPGRHIHTLGDAHIYLNHVDAAKQMLERQARPNPLVTVVRGIADIDSFEARHVNLIGYNPQPSMKLPVAV